jgi:Putative beta barrel porin-7 (BBP7)
MRIGFLAGTRTGLLAMVAAATCVALPTPTQGQSPYGAPTPGAHPNGARPSQALYMAPGESQGGRQRPSYVDAYGNPIIVPTGFGHHEYGGYGGYDGGGCGPDGCDDGCNSGCDGGCDDGGGGDGGCYGGGDGGCYGPHGAGPYGGFNSSMPMGAGGTNPPIGYDLMNDVGIEGSLVDQRGPHYFDIRAEAVFLQRDENFRKNIDITSQNVGNTIVLSTGHLDLNTQAGFRILGRYDICPLSVVEFGYMGIFDWNDSASFTDPTNNLFSLFSRPAPGTGQFGLSPAGVNLPGGPNPETERAHKHSIELESDLQSAEISYRRYWLGWFPRISGTLLAGFRYTRVDDDFTFKSQGSEPATNFPLGPLAALRYDEECENNLAGFQAGGDMWISLTQGLRFGSEAKVGLYNNHWRLTNEITTTPFETTPPTLFEKFDGNHAAFIGEASLDLVADILPSLSLRGGYEILYLSSLVVAGDNFNETSPYGNQGPRIPFVNDDGDLFYHGAHVGVEYIW